MTTRPWLEDPIGFAAESAAQLTPLGVKRFRVAEAGVEIEFYEGHGGERAEGDVDEDGEGDLDELDDEGGSVLDQRMTYNGRPPPTYGPRPRRNRAPREDQE